MQTKTHSDFVKQAQLVSVLNVQHLYKSFGTKKVLQDFNLDLYPGENVVVLGKSGSGKSVLIKCIIGLIKPDAGNIVVLGQLASMLSQQQLDQLRTRIGFLFQSNALYDSMTVRENLEFPLRKHQANLSEQEVEHLICEALENVGLPETIDMLPAELSGGMRKRIALARILTLKPEIILYDEPTTGLDPITAREISQLIIAIQEKYHTASIVISHDMNTVKMVASRIIMLIDGKCYAEGSFQQLQNSGDPRIRDFFI